jgi:hypothetical protein
MSDQKNSDIIKPIFDEGTFVNEIRKKPGLYAFVSENPDTGEKIVRYVGKVECGSKQLDQRLANYQRIHIKNTKSHAKRGRRIKDLLDKNQKVLIFALIPDQITKYREIEINLIDGLEYPIAHIFKTRHGVKMWNERCV